jgi:hypothetical protein
MVGFTVVRFAGDGKRRVFIAIVECHKSVMKPPNSATI